MNKWYRKHGRETALRHNDWNAFQDPNSLVYRTYNIVQDTQETYVDGLLNEHNEIGYDRRLPSMWVDTLHSLYTPSRYLQHAVQMASAYLVHMAPASSISICAAFQMGDALRWISRIAYRTRELERAFPSYGFARDERQMWEEHAAWQGFRELLEKIMVVYDWDETFFALNAIAKIAIDEACLRQLGGAAQQHGDPLLRLLCDSQLEDSFRSRHWTAALIKLLTEEESNRRVLREWQEKWSVLADAAMTAFCEHLPTGDEALRAARAGAETYTNSLSILA
jgi:toluene monooxygenase system protein E